MTKRGERTMSDPNVLNNIRWPGPFDDIPLRVDPQREAEAMGEVEAHRIATGIYVVSPQTVVGFTVQPLMPSAS